MQVVERGGENTYVLSLENVEGCDADFQYYTGLPSIGIFDAIYNNLLAPVVPYVTYVGTIRSGSSQRRRRERQLSPREFFSCVGSSAPWSSWFRFGTKIWIR